MNCKKMIAGVVMASVLTTGALYADDFDFGDLMEENGGAEVAGGSLAVSGEVSVPLRMYAGDFFDFWGYDLLRNSEWSWNDVTSDDFVFDPELLLDLSYDREKTGLKAVLDISEDTVTDHPEDIFDEATATWYGDRITTTLGYQKVVWGKGDKVHAMDVLNPMDYTEFMTGDYLDRKISQPMVKFAIPMGNTGLAELVWVPTFTADRLAGEGIWVDDEVQGIIDTVTDAVSVSAQAAYTDTYAYLTALGGYTAQEMEAAASLAQTSYVSENSELDDFLPDTTSLKYSQAALHYTASIGPVDLGALYYFGYNRLPSVYVDGTTADDISIEYDRNHVFGIEAGAVVLGFNLRGECAYTMTEDFDGKDDEVFNPSIRYVAGFDRDVPINNMNVNLQFYGDYTLMQDGITASNDVEAESELERSMMILNISDTFNHEKIKPEITFGYGFEARDGFVTPAVTVDTDGNLSCKVSGTAYFGDDDTTYGQYCSNGFVELEAVYEF